MHIVRSLVYTRYKLGSETTEEDVLAAAEQTTEPKGSHTAQETGQPPAEKPATGTMPAAKAPGPSPAQVLARALIRKHTEGGRRHGDAA